jgi:hypothetical protein
MLINQNNAMSLVLYAHMSHAAQKTLHKEKEEYGWGNGNTQNLLQKKGIWIMP